ncbi:MAG: GNAT family N-acetyltransferase [Simkaniaceae bacterium]|nr:GNAT family N-acetyltransferase [Simkaniaceae bacterium]
MNIASQLTFRLSEKQDALPLKLWLQEPGILKGFPMINEREVDDAIRIWLSYIPKKSTLTALLNGKACGMANLYLQPNKKLSHQCLFVIVVDKEYRGQGVGRRLLEELINLAKQQFHIEILHLEVYEHNPAFHLYSKLGFTEYGRQKNYLKENGVYHTKILMQKSL